MATASLKGELQDVIRNGMDGWSNGELQEVIRNGMDAWNNNSERSYKPQILLWYQA